MSDNSEIKVLSLKVLRYAIALCGNQKNGEDLTQEAFYNILKKKKDADFWYAIKTVKNLFIDQKRRAKIVTMLPLEKARGHNNEKVIQPPFYPSLWDALMQLKEFEREVIYLSVVEGFTAKEIGEKFNTPRGTILSLISRSKAKLRIILSEDLPKSKSK